MGDLQGCTGVRRSGRLRITSSINPVVVVDVELSEESEESEEEEWNPRSKAGSRPRGIKASAEENAVGVDSVVHTLASAKLSETKAKNPQVVANTVKSHVELRNSPIAVPQELVVEELDAMEVTDLVSGSSDDDDDSTDDEILEEEQEVLDRSLTSEGAALLAEVEKVLAGGDLNKLRVDHLKAYLRHHGLRIAGVKAVLLSRIGDHLRLKDGQGERLYPGSSFRINCRGDVCIGDTVLFRHTVYNNDNINGYKRHGRALGDRWVAGRVASESYGARKQQHTFTIEVFWSTGVRPFYILQPIQIKGRNLYRMTTMRQPWNNEAHRLKALEEKHARGAEARAQRQRRVGTGASSKGPSRSMPNKRSQANTQAGAVRPHHTNPTQHHPRDRPRMESCGDVRPGPESHRLVARPGPVARDQARAEPGGNVPPTNRAQHHPRDRPRMESCADSRPGPESHRLVPRPGPVAGDQARAEPGGNVPPMMRQGFVPMGCSTRGCERAGAWQCVMRSCGPCCYRNTVPKGSCPRHHDIK